MALGQFLLILIYKMYFFGDLYDDKTNTNTSTSTTNTTTNTNTNTNTTTTKII